MEAKLCDDGTVEISGVDGVFRKVEKVKPVTQAFDDDGWNPHKVSLTSCRRCNMLIPPFTRWEFCPGCGVKLDWGDE